MPCGAAEKKSIKLMSCILFNSVVVIAVGSFCAVFFSQSRLLKVCLAFVCASAKNNNNNNNGMENCHEADAAKALKLSKYISNIRH